MSSPWQSVLNTSGTYNFAPALGEEVVYAFQLCGVQPTALTQNHYQSARMAANTLLGTWSANGVQLYQVDLQTVTLVQGQSTYQVPSNTVVILDAYYTISNGTTNIDRIMLPVSRTEYASYPNKQQQGSPTVFWLNRLLSPTVSLWPTPDGQQASFNYYRLRQAQDAVLAGGLNPEVPYFFLEAFCFGLAVRLAMVWAPEKVPVLKTMADEAWGIASKQLVETANFYVSPIVNSYYR